MVDEKAYRSRDFDPSGHLQYLDLLQKQLADAEHKTDPTIGSSASGKDHEAFSTLLCVGHLVDAVAGWALDHVYGLSLAGMKMLPRQPRASKSHPEYVESRRLADLHEHELGGGQAIAERPASAEIRRLILRNLVFAGAGGFPAWLRTDLLEALDALDNGTALSLLAPAKRKGTEYAKARARLRLVAFVKFRSRAFAISEDEARSYVGGKVGRGAEALKDWEQRLKDSCLGALEVHRQITFAINAASFVRNAMIGQSTGNVTEEDLMLSNDNQRAYGEEMLAEAVAMWRQAERLEGSN